MVRWLLLFMAVLATPAWAGDEAVSPVRFHKGQFGGSARFGVGARGILTYENTTYCGKSDPQAAHLFASVCAGRAPLALDLEAAYGVTGTIELTLELRIGLESDFGTGPGIDGPRAFHVAPGARFFFSEADRSKLFIQPMLVFDFSGYDNKGNDFGVKGIEGYWIDLHRSYGLYFFVSETLGFSRWLSGSFEGGVGFQGRYP